MATFVSSNIPASAMDLWISGVTFYTGGASYTGDSNKVALYGTTPDSALAKNDTPASRNAYNGASGQWVVANESTGTNYTAGGTALVSPAHNFGTGTMQLTASNPSWATVTLSAVFGCLVYDTTATTKYAYCWNYFGGSQSVTAGTFTIVWSGSGILQITLT